MLSKSCEHGIKAMICITNNSLNGKRISIGEICAKIQIPEAYTSKVLQKLVKGGLVKSKKGAMGGYYIEDELLPKLTLWHVVNELDGDNIKYGCIFGLSECSSKNPCPGHEDYKKIRYDLIQFFEKTYLASLTEKLNKGETKLFVY